MSVPLVKQAVAEALETLSEAQLQEVADYVAFLQFRGRRAPQAGMEPARLAALYSEFAAEDRALAEEGLGDYRESLLREDAP